MSLASRNLNSALCSPTPTAKDRSTISTSNHSSDDHPPLAAANTGEVEAIRVAVRLKPLSANSDYDEIDPQIGRAWKVLPESHTIVQECPSSDAAIATPGRGMLGGAFTPGKFATPGKHAAGLLYTPGKKKRGSSGDSGSGSSFTFDRVYGENSTTYQIYDGMVKDIVDSVAQKGINGTVFAYGQTSSGKTFTMQGNRQPPPRTVSQKLQLKKSTKNIDGVTHMAARDIFDQIAADTAHSYAVRVSFLELYNEEVRDLLVAPDRNAVGPNAGIKNLAVREDPKRGVFVENLTSHRVYNLDTLLHYLNIGERHKSMAATGMNDRSSRSHTIFRITVEKKKKAQIKSPVPPKATSLQTRSMASAAKADSGKENATGSSCGSDGVKLVATLNLVDLAGSESVRHTGATGSRQKEGGKINQSLLTLSRVIMGLGKTGKGGKAFVNYRDSKLTRILQSSLSGNARMAVICCATMSDAYVEETKSTLQFASRAKLVKTRATVNEISEDPSVIKKLQREIAQRSEEGKQALRQLRELEQSAKDAEKAAADANKKLEKLYDFVRSSDTISLLPQEREYGQVLSTRNCSYTPAVKATPAKPFAKAPLDRRSAMKKQFSESLFVRTSLGGGDENNHFYSESIEMTAMETTFVSPRYAETVAAFDPSSTQVTLLKDALAAKTMQVKKLMEQSRKVDSSDALTSLQEKAVALKAKIDGLTREKNDALDWIEELYSQADKRDNDLKEAIFEKEEASIEIEALRKEVESLKDMQVKSAGDNERICDDLRTLYEEKVAKLQLELEETSERLTKQEKSLQSAKEERDLAFARVEKVAMERDEANSTTKELLQEKNTLLENLDDLSIENQQALQIIEELTNDKESLMSENESLRRQIDDEAEASESNATQLAVALEAKESELQQLKLEHATTMDTNEELQKECDRMATEIQDSLTIIQELTEKKSQIIKEKDVLQEQLDNVHSLVVGDKSSELSDSTQTLQILEELTGAMETNENLSSECRRMTVENQELKEQVEHLNSSLRCQSDIAKSTEEELVSENLDLRDEIAQNGIELKGACTELGQIREENQKLSGSLTETTAQLDQALGDNASLRKDVETLQNDLDEKTQQLDCANTQTEHMQEDISSLKGQIDGLKASLVQQRAEILESTEQEFIARGDEEKRKLLNRIKEYETVAENQNQELVALSSEIANCLDSNASLSAKAGEMERNLEMQKDLVARVSSELEESKSQLSAANDVRQQLTHESRRVVNTNAVLETRTSALERDLRVSEEKTNNVAKDLQESKKQIAAVMNERDQLEDEKQRILDMNDDLEAKAQKFAMDVKEHEEMISELSTKLTVAQEELADAKTNADSFGKSENELKSVVSDLTAQKARLDNEISSLRDQVETTSSILQETKSQLARANDQVERLMSEKQNIMDEKTTFKSNAERLSTEIKGLQEKISGLSANLAVAGETESELTAQVDSLRGELATNKKEMQELHSMYSEKSEAEASLQNEIEELTNALTEKSRDIERQRLSLSSKEQEESDTNRRLAMTLVAKSKLDTEVRDLKRQVKEISLKLQEKDTELEETANDAKKMTSMETDLSQILAEKTILRNELDRVSRELDSVQQELHLAQSAPSSSVETDMLKDEVKEQKRFLAAKDSEIKSVTARIKRLSVERDDAVKSMMVLRREKSEVTSALEARIAELEGEGSSDHTKTLELSDAVHRISKEKAELERELERAEKEKSNAYLNAKRIRRESSSSQSNVERLKNELETSNAKKEELEDQVRQLEKLVKDSEGDVRRVFDDRRDMLRDHSKKIAQLMEDKREAQREINTLVKKIEDMAMHMDMLEASKASSEALASRLLEQKHRALNRLDDNKERYIEEERRRSFEQQQERQMAQERERDLQKEKENEIRARELKLEMLQKERNSIGKISRRGLRLVGKEVRHKAEAAKHALRPSNR